MVRKEQRNSYGFLLSTFYFLPTRAPRGMTLMEVVIAMSLMLLIFLGFFGAYAASADLVRSASARLGAVTLVASRLEYIRGIPYADVGVMGGTPSGTLAPSEVRIQNAVTYTIRTVVADKDDSANGTGASDYKSVQVEAGWNFRGAPQSISTVTYVAP